MADIITMPKLGFDMAEGTLVRWIILEGESVSIGAILAEIETDKAIVEVESQFEGIVFRHLVPIGEIVPINSPIAIIADQDESVDLEQLLGEEILQEKNKKAPQEKQSISTSKTLAFGSAGDERGDGGSGISSRNPFGVKSTTAIK